jgi:cobalt-zinc-cadmium efflux system outer membrane protein
MPRFVSPAVICVAVFLRLLVGAPAAAAKFTHQIAQAAPAAPATQYAPLTFQNLTLAQAESMGLARSPDVTIAKSRVQSAEAALAAARGALGPSVISGYTSNPQAGSAPNATVTQTLFNVGVQETLVNFAGYLPQLYQAQATLDATRADEATAERTERTRVATLYFGALSARATMLARRQALDTAREQERAARRRFAAGDAPRVDVVRAQVATAQAQAALETAQAADQNAGQALELETGFTGNLIPVAGQPITVTLPWNSAEAAVAAALPLRSEILSAKEDVAAADAAASGAKAAGLPALTVSAGYARGLDTGQPVAGPMVTAALEFPLNGFGSARVAQARAAAVEAQAHLTAAQRLVTTGVATSYRNFAASVLAAAASTKARVAAQEELQATETGYRNGASSSLDVALAAATYAGAQIAELTAIYDEALAREVLSLEVGP